VFEALAAIPPSQRTRDVHIVSNDTMVESPLVTRVQSCLWPSPRGEGGCQAQQQR
jgi:hypothetical protein